MIPGVSQFANVAKGVGSYVGNIAQNVRDVGTAFGTNAKIGMSKGLTSTAESNPMNKRAEGNLITQVKEVGGSFLGKPGTRSDQYSPSTGYVSGSKLKK
jgi:hypothetical protein